jgi:uncharacterized oxidoreductase
MIDMTTLIDLKQANVLITGGSDGIGLGLAKRYLAVGSSVLITGRNPKKLESAQRALPGLLTLVNDISKPEERQTLAKQVEQQMPDVNVLINNAGIQRRVSLASDTAAWPERQLEIDTLLSGPIHLNHLLVPLMLKHNRPSLLVNVTSGGAFVPQVFAPVYSACKAALHSYTVTLRHALQATPIRVVELIPPRVQTALGGHGATQGAPLDEFCDEVFTALQRGDNDTVGFGPTNTSEFKQALRATDSLFKASALRFPIATYASEQT